MPWDGFFLRGLVADHEREAGVVEHACLRVDGFTEVLRFDEWVLASVFLDFAVYIESVFGIYLADIVCGVHEHAADAVFLLGFECDFLLACE